MNAPKISQTVGLPEAAHRPFKGGAGQLEAQGGHLFQAEHNSHWLQRAITTTPVMPITAPGSGSKN